RLGTTGASVRVGFDRTHNRAAQRDRIPDRAHEEPAPAGVLDDGDRTLACGRIGLPERTFHVLPAFGFSARPPSTRRNEILVAGEKYVNPRKFPLCNRSESLAILPARPPSGHQAAARTVVPAACPSR